MSDIIINQHYVPQLVLKRFSVKNYVYETLVEQSKIYPTNYRNSMSERFTYEHPALEQNKLEKFFQDIENDLDPALYQVIELLEDNKIAEAKQLLDSFCTAFVIFYYRSGALLSEFSFESTVKESRVGHLLQKLSNPQYINSLGDTLNFYDFAIIKSEKNDFLISDQFISTVALGIKGRFANISNRHIGLKDVMIVIPISSKYYAIYFHGRKPHYIKKEQINLLNDSEVEEINRVIINNSYMKSVAQNKESLEKALHFFTYKSPSGVHMGFENGSVSGATLKKELFFYDEDEKAWQIFTNPVLMMKFKDLRRNDPCGCESGKKLKNCCIDYVNITDRIWMSIRDKQLANKIRIDARAMTEWSVTEYFGKTTL